MGEEHQCLHEVDLALMSKSVIAIEQQLKDDAVKEDKFRREIYEAIKGNGKPGLNPRLSVVEDSLARLWKWFAALAIALIINGAARGFFGG